MINELIFIHKCVSTGLFPPMLRLLTTHFPQLCIVNEWLEEGVALTKEETSATAKSDSIHIEKGSFQKGNLTWNFVVSQ